MSSVFERLEAERKAREAEYNALPFAEYTYIAISKYKYSPVQILGSSRDGSQPYKLHHLSFVNQFGNVVDTPEKFSLLDVIKVVRKLNEQKPIQL